MASAMRFGDVLEAADQLSVDEQQELIAILNRRLTHARRGRLADDIEEARLEHAESRAQPVTPADLMRELQS